VLNAGGAPYALTPLATQGDPWNLNYLYDFCSKKSCADESTPFTAAILNINGAFYGTTSGSSAKTPAGLSVQKN
jgi:hypothetical protein